MIPTLDCSASSPELPSSPESQHATFAGRLPLAQLERPVDLAILLAPEADAATVSQALASLPLTLPAAVILVTSSDPDVPSPVDPFSTACVHTMSEAGHEEILTPGWVLLPPAGSVLLLARRGNAVHTILHERAAIDGSGPIDALLASAAAAMGERVLVAAYGGNTFDGVDGCSQVRAAGGRVIQLASDSANAPALLNALANQHISHGTWPRAALGAVLADCIMHGRHDPRRPAKG